MTLSKASLAPILEADPRIAESFSRVLATREQATEATLEDHRSTAHDRFSERDERSILKKIQTFFSLG